MIEDRTYTTPKEAELIGGGIDSMVYRPQSAEVLKIYPGMPLKQIHFYQEITNRAAEVLNSQPFTGEIPTVEGSLHYRYKVNPISEVGVTECGVAVAVSPFVAGPRLLNLLMRRDISSSNPFQQHLMTIDDTEERNTVEEFARRVRSFSSKDPLGWRVSEGIHLSQLLNTELGTRGVSIVSINVKVCYSGEEILYVVTDLCSSVRALMPLRGGRNNEN